MDSVQWQNNTYWLEHCTGIAEVRIRISAGLAFFGQLHKLRL